MPKTQAPIEPLYLQVKNHVRQKVSSGEWPTSSRVPSENEIVKAFGVSRMTANRALRELQNEGVVVRVAGVGSFVASGQSRTHPLEIRNIAEEIRARGHAYRSRLVALERVRASAEQAVEFGIAARSELFFSSIVHFEGEMPLLLEDRHVLPRIGPDYLSVDFTTLTPYDYLMRVAPLQEAEHVLRAVLPEERVRRLLAMKRGEPCLLMIRRTWTAGVVASVARLHYPGSRYEMSGRFHP